MEAAGSAFGAAIVQPGRTVINSPDGVQCLEKQLPAAADARFPRHARFIWLDPEKFPELQKTPATFFVPHDKFKATTVLFEKSFDFDSDKGEAIIRITADRRYRLYINGIICGHGPAAVGGDYADVKPAQWYFYDTYDLTGKLFRGANTVRIEVMLTTRVQTDYSSGHAGLLAEITQSDKIILATDKSWRALPDPRVISLERYDFTQADPDECTWNEAFELPPETAAGWHLQASPVPVPMEAKITPERIHCPLPGLTETDDGFVLSPGIPRALELDFAKETVGFFHFDIETQERVELKVEYRESPDRVHRTEYILLAPGRNVYRGWRLDVCLHIRLTVGRLARPLIISQVGMIYSSFPVAYKGSFKCSSNMYNDFWTCSRRTLQMCMQSCYLDSPIHQEALGCTGDYYIESLLAGAIFGDTVLAAADLRRTKYYLEHNEHQMFHTSYSLLWVEMLREHYRYTADTTILEELLPEVIALLDAFHGYCDDSGLVVNAPSYMFMDWVSSAGHELHHPPAAIGMGYMSAFYCRALSGAIMMLEAVGKDASLMHERLSRTKSAIREKLFDVTSGIFKDGIAGISASTPHRYLPPDPPRETPPTYSIQTNAAMIWAQIVAPEEGRLIFARLQNMPGLPPVQPYFMHFVFEALKYCNAFEDHGFELLDSFKKLYDLHPSTWAEAWDFGDFCHAWSATSAWQLSTVLLGVKDWTPGFYEVEISPIPGNLQWCSGVFPTIHGDLKIQWRRDERNHMQLTVSAPAAVRVKITRPPGIDGFSAIVS
ncbi:MAG: hypothetical protein JXR78_09555 [Victivallales bacterium]|nr:hypothetical protein [Victivallales bacterium]